MKAVITGVIVFAVFLIAAPQATMADSDSTKPAPAIYDTTANAQAQIAKALALAKETERRVLIQWGANWCSWCRRLHSMFETDSLVHQALESNYVWVLADVGRKNKNLDLQEKYKVDQKAGIPYLTVLDTEGNVVVNQETGALELKDSLVKGHDPKAVLGFLETFSGKKESD